MPTVASVQLAGTVLTVQTDNQNSNISVVQNPGTVTIRDGITNQVWNYSTSQVSKVIVSGSSGDDSFVSTGNVGVIVWLYGRGGNDYLVGDSGPNLIVGGPGNDLIYGGSGKDTLKGLDGNDFIAGQSGNDIIEGGNGNDSLIGGQGADAISGAAGDDVLVTIDGTNLDVADAGTGTDTAWVDLINGVQESVTGLDGTDYIRPVAAFANGADLTLNGDRIKVPTLISQSNQYETFNGRPLFAADGPTINDINQTLAFGNVPVLDDSWLLASLGAMVQSYPNLIKTNVVDFGDGTYGVRFNGVFYRVDNRFPVLQSGDVVPGYAGTGIDNSLWVAVVEKAAATNANPTNPTYVALDNFSTGGLSPTTANTLFGGPTSKFFLPGTFISSDQLGSVLKQFVAKNYSLTLTVNDDPSGALVSDQTYSLTSLTLDAQGLCNCGDIPQPHRRRIESFDSNPTTAMSP
ncbi:MAG: hypothetical protein U0792_25485 [Gemmataceae bacterium]